MSRLVDFWNEGAAERLIKGLEDNGLRAEDLAESIDVEARTVRNWMVTDKPPTGPGVQNFAQLCRILQVSQDEFRSAAEAYSARKVGILLLERAGTTSASESRVADTLRSQTTYLTFMIVGLAIVVLVLLLRTTGRTKDLGTAPVVPPPITFEIPSRESGVYDSGFRGDVSPDGSEIAFLARSVADGRRMLFVHSVADRVTRPVPGSAGHYTSFFWNSDSRSIFYIAKTDLIKVKLAGDGAERVGDVGEALRGAVNRSGKIVLGSSKGLLAFREKGEPEPLTELAAGEIAHTLPSFLPDDDKILFSITSKNDYRSITRSLAVLSLRSRSVRRLFELPSRAHFAHGHLFWVESDSLVAQPFDPTSLRLTGAKIRLASPVWSDLATGEVGFTLCPSVLVVTPPLTLPPLFRVASDGTVLGVTAKPSDIRYLAVANRSQQLALAGRGDQRSNVTLWLLSRGSDEPTPLVTGTDPTSLVFSPDDQRIYYAAPGVSFGNIYAVAARRGSEPVSILLTGQVVAPRDISPDERFLLYQQWLNRDGNLWYMPIQNPALARPFVSTAEEEGGSARFSPDGRSVAFVAKRGGEFSIYLADFPPTPNAAPTRAIARDGWKPRWSRDGRSIYFVRGRTVFRADRVTREATPLFEMKREIWNFEIADEDEFYVQETANEPSRMVATSWWPRVASRPMKLAENSSAR